MMIVTLLITYGLSYALYIGYLIWGWKKNLKKQYLKSLPQSEAVSIIIPCRNEEKNIAYLLQILTHKQDWQNSYEIICVNDHSEDNTKMIIQTYDGVKCFDLEGNFGKKASITYGISQASGSIIVLTDADCIPEEKWINHLLGFFSDTDIQMVCGWVKIIRESSFFSGLAALEFSTLTASSAALAGHHRPILCNGANLAFRRSAFDSVKGYENDNMASGDDVLLMHRIKAAYGRNAIAYAVTPPSSVHTYLPNSFQSFWRQRLRWAGKATAYTDKEAISISWLVFIFHALLWVPLLFLWMPGMLLLWLLTWGIKTILDSIFIITYTTDMGMKKLLYYLLPLSMVYWIYVPCVAIASVFAKQIKWKGREYNAH
ncbi:MAG: glycosyltransferase [Flavobacteriales bacterium]|nr:glycosyltransferase [Flavobacteriales bacterium]